MSARDEYASALRRIAEAKTLYEAKAVARSTLGTGSETGGYERTVRFGIIAGTAEEADEAWGEDGPELGPLVFVLDSSAIEEAVDKS